MSNFTIFLAEPRGFCAGVERAIEIVEAAVKVYGPPIYVKHEIVHNEHVVSRLKEKGVVFIEDLEEVPIGARLIFSAHGVSPEVKQKALKLGFQLLDATCPLVEKVHKEATRYKLANYKIILIGHRNHVEVIGTMGYAPENITLISKVEDVAKLKFDSDDDIAFITQTTLSIDDTKDIVSALRKKYPSIRSGLKDDICYATTNRQNVVKLLAREVDLFLIVGSRTSSNTQRLVETAKACGTKTFLITSANDIKKEWLEGVETLGVSSGASAPEDITQSVVQTLLKIKPGKVVSYGNLKETTKFAMPYTIREDLRKFNQHNAL